MKRLHKSYFRCFALLAIVTTSFGSASHAQSWDLSDDYSISANPNGAWSYGSAKSFIPLAPPSEPFVPFVNQSIYMDSMGATYIDVPFWHSSNPSSPLGVYKNESTSAQTINEGLTVPAETVFFHPANGPAHAVVRWTAPQDGIYDLTAFFWLIEENQTDVDVHIEANGVGVLQGVLGRPSAGLPLGTSYAGSLALAKDDIVDFTVGLGSTGFTYDTTAIDVTITKTDGSWTDLGEALAGSLGAPLFAGTGSLIGGQSISISLSNAKALTQVWLIGGLSQISAPFFGGVLVPSPDVILGGFPTDTSGTLNLGATWPAGLPSGTNISWQFWISDASGPAGFTASNGLLTTTP